MELEIADYLTRITSEAVSLSSTEDINSMLCIISDLESIGDSCTIDTIKDGGHMANMVKPKPFNRLLKKYT